MRRNYIGWLLALLAYVLVWFVYPVDLYTPYLGVAILSFVTALGLLIFDKHRNVFKHLLILTIMCLSPFFILRANQTLILANFVCIVFLHAIYIVDVRNILTTVNILFSPVFAFGELLDSHDEYSLTIEKGINVKKIATSLGLTMVSIAIIVPILASANPVFSQYVQSVMKLFDIDTIALTLVRLIFAGLLLLVINRAIHILLHGEKTTQLPVSHFVTHSLLTIPKIVIAIIIGIFIFAQFQLYTASPQTLAALGYTKSHQVNEIFVQMCIVAAILIGFIFYDRSTTKITLWMHFILIVETLLLAMFGFKSDVEYISLFGLTSKRLWGMVAVSLVVALVVHLIRFILNKIDRIGYLKSAVVTTGCILVIVNILNFDYLIYHTNKARTQKGVDYMYLSQLSTDAAYFPDLFHKLTAIRSNEDEALVKQILIKANEVMKYNKHPGIRAFNHSLDLARRSVNPADLARYRSYLYAYNDMHTFDSFQKPQVKITKFELPAQCIDLTADDPGKIVMTFDKTIPMGLAVQFHFLNNSGSIDIVRLSNNKFVPESGWFSEGIERNNDSVMIDLKKLKDKIFSYEFDNILASSDDTKYVRIGIFNLIPKIEGGLSDLSQEFMMTNTKGACDPYMTKRSAAGPQVY